MQWIRIVTDGAVLSALAMLVILLSLRANPRIWLNDFPPDIRSAVPPKTDAEKRVDLLVIDWLIICAVTPRWLVVAGTEGMAGYSDYRHHFRGFLVGCIASAVFALPAAALVYLT